MMFEALLSTRRVVWTAQGRTLLILGQINVTARLFDQ